MGMDVNGRGPAGKEGEYFRANAWSWVPIYELILELCSDLFDEETLDGMGANTGAGPSDQETCTEMAVRFERWLAKHPGGFSVESHLQVNEQGVFVTEEDLADDPTLKTESPYSVSDEELREWIAFLRSCGGFEVC